MLKKLFRRFLGDRDTSREQTIKHYQPRVAQINEYFEQYESLSDTELAAMTDGFRQRLEAGGVASFDVGNEEGIVREPRPAGVSVRGTVQRNRVGPGAAVVGTDEDA